MQGLILSLLASVATPGVHIASTATPARMAAVPPAGIHNHVSDWMFNGQTDADCELRIDGEPFASAGATLALQCQPNAKVLGVVSTGFTAQGWHQRRVTVSVEMPAGDAAHASLWVKTQRQAGRPETLMFEDDTEQRLLDDAQTDDGWVRRSVTLPIAADANQVSFGVLLHGASGVNLRDVRVNVSEPGMIAPEAAQLLDAAIGIVKQQTAHRTDLRWQLLEPQLRLFASGAQSPAEVYPAIKYLLSRLGDKQSLLLAPDAAKALGRNEGDADSGDTRVQVFALPDGAQLVLSRRPAEMNVRTAQNRAEVDALP